MGEDSTHITQNNKRKRIYKYIRTSTGIRTHHPSSPVVQDRTHENRPIASYLGRLG